MRRAANPLLDLPYGFLIDDLDIRGKNLPAVAWNMAGDSAARKSSNRLLLNAQRPNELFFAEPSRDYVDIGPERIAVPDTNDLLITRLPNFLSVAYRRDEGKTPNAWGRLVVVQGTHGIGTRAVELLLTHKGKDPLLAAKKEIANARAFQSHFRVSKPELTSAGYHRFKNIEHIRSVPVNIPLRNYVSIRSQIDKDFGVLR
jgi:hypothetical protein